MVPHFILESSQIHASFWAYMIWIMEKLMTSLLSVCWTDELLRMIVVIVIIFLLIIIFLCLLIFYNKLTFAIFVPCDWCLWWSRTFVRGSRWAAIGDLEGSLLLELPSRCDNIEIYFGGELCFVMNSSLVDFLNLLIGHVSPKFRYM